MIATPVDDDDDEGRPMQGEAGQCVPGQAKPGQARIQIVGPRPGWTPGEDWPPLLCLMFL